MEKSTLLIKPDPECESRWLAAMAPYADSVAVRLWPEVGAPAEVDFALLWAPPPGLLASLVNLRAVFSIGAGVDNILRVPDLPRQVPLVRMVDKSLTEGMGGFVVYQCLRFHRDFHRYEAQQIARKWKARPQRPAAERRIGIMGLGELGGFAARQLCALGFTVRGWSRRPRAVDGVETFAGPGGLEKFLRGCDIVVCLLPLSPQTEKILNAKTLAMLPPGACVINAARGAHVDDAALIAALDRGHLKAAALDVFNEEPLPTGHSYWRHPKVTITPHAAAFTLPESAAAQVVENIRRHRRGEALLNLVDREAGY